MMIGATDGHAKNFSLFMQPGGRFHMTPLYDILSTQWQHDSRQIPRNAFRLAMAVGDRRRYKVSEIAPRHFEQMAKLAGFPTDELRTVMGEIVSDFPHASETVTDKLDECVPESMVEAILTAARK